MPSNCVSMFACGLLPRHGCGSDETRANQSPKASAPLQTAATPLPHASANLRPLLPYLPRFPSQTLSPPHAATLPRLACVAANVQKQRHHQTRVWPCGLSPNNACRGADKMPRPPPNRLGVSILHTHKKRPVNAVKPDSSLCVHPNKHWDGLHLVSNGGSL